jgi:hypothetical protein
MASGRFLLIRLCVLLYGGLVGSWRCVPAYLAVVGGWGVPVLPARRKGNRAEVQGRSSGYLHMAHAPLLRKPASLFLSR